MATWTPLSYPFGSLLTSTKMTQNQANFTAMGEGAASAPNVDSAAINGGTGSALVDGNNADSLHVHAQAGISASAIGQGEVKSTTGTVNSVSTTGTSLTLPGGEYGFYPQIKYVTGGGGTTGFWGRSTSPNEAARTTSGSFLTQIMLHVDTDGTTTAQQRYFQASPPYKIGNIEWGHFLFLLRNVSTDEIISSYEAEDPPWAYNGPPNNKKDSRGRIQAVPHPFADYFDKDPSIDGLEIQLINLSEFNMPDWRNENAAESILEDLGNIITNPSGTILTPAQAGIGNIPGFTDKIKIRARN